MGTRYREDVTPLPADELEPEAPATFEQALAQLARLLVSKAADGEARSTRALELGLPMAVSRSTAASVEAATEVDRTAAARYQTLIEQIPAVTFLASLTGDQNELYVSPQIESLLGFTQEEWLSDPILWYRQTHPDDRERVSINFARACATGEPFRDVIRVSTRGGNTVWVHAEARLVRDADGQPLFLQGVGFDVTDQHRAQEVREELIREQVERAQADRERQRKDQFLAAAAHDLKTPITAIKGLAQVMERRMARDGRVTADEFQPMLTTVRKSADRMAKLVDQLLDISRMDSGAPLALNRMETDMVALLTEAIEDHRAISDRHELVLESAPAELRADVDAPRIERVLSNLLTNAVKYSPDGGRVGVRLSLEENSERPQLVLQVQDQGMGIPAAELPHIFERFHRGSNVPEQVSGTGIGLAYVEQVVRDHDGRIDVESHEGAGSTFTVFLPLRGATTAA